MSKVYVQKTGPKSFRVFVDEMGLPIPLTSGSQEVAGMMQMYHSPNEVNSAFPGRELVILERPSTPPNIIVPSQEVKDAAAKVLGGVPVSEASKRVVSKISTPLAIDNTGQEIRNYLTTLEMAKSYASKKFIKVLEIKIEAINELLKHIERS